MKRLLTSLGAAAILATALFPVASHAASQHSSSRAMSVAILPATGPRTINKAHTVTFHVKVTGITLDARDMGKAAKAGTGHLQVYVDRIPGDAYSKKDLKHNWLAALASPTFALKLSAPVLGGRGTHKIIVALAKNNYVLYRVPVASFTVTVK